MSKKPAADKINVLIVDDHELLRSGLRALLGNAKNISVCGEAEGMSQAIAQFEQQRPDVVLLDVRLKDGNGLDCCRELKRLSGGDVRVLFFSGYPEEQLIMEAVRAGADGYLLKAVRSDLLIDAIATVMTGEPVWDPVVTKFLIRKEQIRSEDQVGLIKSLSKQEVRIAAYVAEGMTNKEIASEMDLADKTVRNYLANAMGKLGVSRRAQLATLYTSFKLNETDM